MKAIYIDRPSMTLNKKQNNDMHPVTRVLFDCETWKANGLVIDGPSRIVYRPAEPLPSGSRLWLETEAPVTGFGRDGDALWELPAG